jgi:hypothetical protein
VGFHGVFADVDNLRDFFVALARSHVLQNLEFAFGKLRMGQRIGEFRGDLRRQRRLSFIYCDVLVKTTSK